MKYNKGKRLFFKLMLILAFGISISIFPSYKYISSEIYEIDRYKAELAGATILSGLSSLIHTSFVAASDADIANSAYFKRNIDDAKKKIGNAAKSIQRSSIYLKQTSTNKFNISSLYAPENIDAFPQSRTISSSLLEMSEGALISSGLYSDSATDRYLLMKICGTYFPKIYSGLFSLQKEIGIDGDKSQLVIIRDEIRDDIEDLVAALRTVAINFEGGNLIQTSSDKIFDMGTSMSESIFSYHEFNPAEIANNILSFETFSAQVWIYCTNILVELLNNVVDEKINELLFFCVEYALFAIFMSVLALVIAVGVKRNAQRTAMLAKYCLTDAVAEVKESYYTIAKRGTEFSLIDEEILKGAQIRERILELSKKLSISCVSNKNEIESAISANSKLMEYAEEILSDLRKSTDDSELDGGVLKAAKRIAETVGKLSEALPAKEEISDGFNSIISTQAAVVESSNDLLLKASESICGLSRLSGEIASIADRANLLSLNISIEVGKSGASGSGLSVLSEQIKILAKRTGVVVLDLDEAAKVCAEAIAEIKSKVSALGTPLSAQRQEADKMLLSISNFENAVTSLSYAANRIEGVAEAREGVSFKDKLAEVQATLEKAEMGLKNFAKSSANMAPILAELRANISNF